MAFDSEEKRSDFEAWADDMTYQEEKELKRQEKLQMKEAKKAEKAAKRNKKKAAGSDDNSEETKSEENNTEVEKTETVSADSSAVSESESKADSQDSPEDKSETKEEFSQNSLADEAKESDEKSEGSSDESDEASEDSAEGKKKKKKEKKESNSDYKKEKEPEEINIVKELLSLIIYIGVVIILCYCIITFVGQRTTVNGQSMQNTLQDGDNLWIDKFTYHFKDPERFDIIVFPYEDDVYYIKRIIGLPGEKVQIMNDGYIYINDKKLTESYGKEIILDPGTASDERVLGEDEYFVLGDNRNDSRDSRWADVGNIERESIIGKAVFRLSPFSKFGKIE